MKSLQKQVTVLATYKFNKIARICFTVLSSNGKEKYNTCFDGSADKGSCTCKALRNCYHLDQLRPVAQAYFESRKQEWLPAYDVVGAALQVVNGAMIGNKIGTAYDNMAAEKIAAIEAIRWVQMPNGTYRTQDQVNDPCLNSLDRMSAAYNKLIDEAERTSRENEACHMRLMQQDF